MLLSGDLVFTVGVLFVFIALGALLALKFRSSIIPFLILIGMLVGPYGLEIGDFSFRIIENNNIVELLGRLGVIFLLFYIGLEFSMTTLIKSGKSIMVGGSLYVGLNFVRGLVLGWLFFDTISEILVVAGITTISSSAIVAKVLVDLKRTANPETEMILGIIMFEDVFVAVYLAVLSGMLMAGGAGFVSVLLAALKALGFMILVLAIGRGFTKQIDRMLSFRSDEVMLIVVFAVLIIVSSLAQMIHVAEAIGALLVGLIIAETSHAKKIEQMIIPMRDLFGAVFFFSFGLSIDFRTLGDAFLLSLVAIVLTILGNTLAGYWAGRATNFSPRQSGNIGLSIISRGEFAIIIANMSLAANLSPLIQPFVALYVLVLAITGPLIARHSKKIFELTIAPWANKKKTALPG